MPTSNIALFSYFIRREKKIMVIKRWLQGQDINIVRSQHKYDALNYLFSSTFALSHVKGIFLYLPLPPTSKSELKDIMYVLY